MKYSNPDFDIAANQDQIISKLKRQLAKVRKDEKFIRAKSTVDFNLRVLEYAQIDSANALWYAHIAISNVVEFLSTRFSQLKPIEKADIHAAVNTFISKYVEVVNDGCGSDYDTRPCTSIDVATTPVEILRIERNYICARIRLNDNPPCYQFGHISEKSPGYDYTVVNIISHGLGRGAPRAVDNIEEIAVLRPIGGRVALLFTEDTNSTIVTDLMLKYRYEFDDIFVIPLKLCNLIVKSKFCLTPEYYLVFSAPKYNVVDRSINVLPNPMINQLSNYDLEFPCASIDVVLRMPYDGVADVYSFLINITRHRLLKELKMTIYRVDQQSRLVDALIVAANRGVKVCVYVECLARGDEQANAVILSKLKLAGVQTIYISERKIKVHGKVFIAEFNQDEGVLRPIVHISTGNYNEATSKRYCDLHYISNSDYIVEMANRFFANICDTEVSCTELIKLPKKMGMLAMKYRGTILPVNGFSGINYVADTITRELDSIIACLESKNPPSVRIIFKVNHLLDTAILNQLKKISDLGAEIHLIVRTSLDLSFKTYRKTYRNIHIHQPVGRFLEHDRFFVFQISKVHEKVFISSADLMYRNLHKRAEIIAKVQTHQAKQYIIDIAEQYINGTAPNIRR